MNLHYNSQIENYKKFSVCCYIKSDVYILMVALSCRGATVATGATGATGVTSATSATGELIH